MNGYIQEKAKNLISLKSSNIVMLIIAALFFLGLGGAVAYAAIMISLEEVGRIEFHSGWLFIIGSLAAGFLCVFFMIRIIKKKKLAARNPLAFVKVFGTIDSIEKVCEAFNKEYAQNKIIGEIKIRGEVLPLAILTDNYMLITDNLKLSLVNMSSIICVTREVSNVSYGAVRTASYIHTFFLNSSGAEHEKMFHATFNHEEQSNALLKFLENKNINIVTDKKEAAALKKLAQDDYYKLMSECRKRFTQERGDL